MAGPVTVVAPVYGNEATLAALTHRLGAALSGAGYDWRLRLVVDASPDASLARARDLAAADRRVGVVELAVNGGQHAALLAGLAAPGPAGGAWVCLDADLQDPPEAVPGLLARLQCGDVGAVFAGRRGAYQDRGRRLTGAAHRVVQARLAGVPADAGAFMAFDDSARAALVALGPPSLVAGVGVAGILSASVPVARAPRPVGTSAWTGPARLRQSARTLAWTWRARPARPAPAPGRRDHGT